MRTSLRLLTAVGSGLALWAAFPDIGWWPLAPVGILLLITACRGVRPLAGFGLGLVAGCAWFVPYVSWTGLHVGYLPWFALALLEALFVGAFGALTALAHRGGPRPSPLLLAALWSTTEWARASFPFGGYPWGRVAYSQADSPLLHLVALGGPALLGLGVALVGTLLLRFVDDLRAGHTGPVLLAPLAGLAALLVLPPLIPAPVEGTPVRVMAVQGNAPRTGLDFNAKRRQILDNHGAVTTEAARRIDAGELPRPDLVVWPENASDIDPFVNPDAGAVIDDAVARIGRPVLVGAVLGGGHRDLTNTSILWLPGVGATGQRYSKRALVPFAEYMPYRSVFRAITRQVDLLERDFVPGTAVGVLDVPAADGTGIRAGLAICFEVAVDRILADDVANGANLLVVQTNNAMFDFSAESAQQLAISRVRAVEYGRSVVHASNVGISALVTPDGVAHERTRLFEPAIVQGTLPLRTDITLAARLGPWTDVLLAVGALLGLALPRVRRRGL